MEVTLEALSSNCSESVGQTQSSIPPRGFYKPRPLPTWDNTCCGGSCVEAVGVVQPYCVSTVNEASYYVRQSPDAQTISCRREICS